MLKDLNVDQARFIALLARTARAQREALLGNWRRTLLAERRPHEANTTPLPSLG